MREERIVIAGRELVIARPDDPERLIDEERFEEDEFMPYWAELWPSGVALAGYVRTHDLAGRHVERTEMVEEHERADAAALRERKNAPDGEPAEVAAACFDDEIDHVGLPSVSIASMTQRR